jgi:hypothetical protein
MTENNVFMVLKVSLLRLRMRLWQAQLNDSQLPQVNRARKYALRVFQQVIQRSSVVERSAVNGKKAFLTCIRNALYIGKIQTPFDPIYQRQYQI